mmetsp:Transcript_15532/g.29280  ORF Transcript_15532/g.29280 Transcript_15532/m.29280 type:complete len:101 (-) Transcript_15532:22-324(-)
MSDDLTCVCPSTCCSSIKSCTNMGGGAISLTASQEHDGWLSCERLFKVVRVFIQVVQSRRRSRRGYEMMRMPTHELLASSISMKEQRTCDSRHTHADMVL